MIIERTRDAEVVNAIANDESVRRLMFLGMRYPEYQMDFTKELENERTIAFVADGFCALFKWSAPGVYECHIMARKGSRGAFMMAAGREMLAKMKELRAQTVWGQPSVYNRAAICYIRRMGLTPYGYGNEPVLGDVQYFVTREF